MLEGITGSFCLAKYQVTTARLSTSLYTIACLEESDDNGKHAAE